ncbi:carbohydrate ABC transporter substrate-binding protein (CUT1 family) [Streptomyces sp. 3211.6]|uniref:ABC transporter substrate-binding protein n=1 Tax=Streptomyces TaxID=1883 RepID=UPI0009A55687|nr:MULTISPECIES: sugar ABC transporter substrate-binding protein [Streptomyces]RKT08033.1 carbohydrate ABC transporter substrate-binding protein (CUT1 family) [Streptomyces sp. 3211.6]RPF44348.1 carbohydrate ABC transporter substrate-binding protein (CUT1 family) [Streptomyces sp. Ag109_G2-6]
MTRSPLTRTAVATAVAAGLLTLSACGLGGAGHPTGEARKTGEVAGEITFRTLQLKPVYTAYVQGLIDSFERKYPDARVKWEDVPGDGYNEKLVADAQAGALPDVVNLSTDSFQLLAGRGMLADVAALDAGVAKEYVPGAWEQFKLPGKGDGVYAYPWYVTPEILTYNQDLFTRSGLDPARPPTTVEQFFDYADQIAARSGGRYAAFMADPKGRLPGDWQKMGVPLLNQAGDRFTFATDQAVAWADRMKDLYAKGAMPKESLLKADDINQLYGSGRLVFGPGSPGFVKDIKANAPQVYAQTRVAGAVTGTLGHIGIYAQSLGIRKDTAHPDAAAEFAKWVTNGPNQVEFSRRATIYPSNAQGLADPRFADRGDGKDAETLARAIGAEQLKTAALDANTPVQWTSQVGDAVAREMQKAIKGEEDSRTAVRKAEEEANRLLAAAGRR